MNEISAIPSSPHVWQHDGPFAETYGLEPNYGCCTANFQQVRGLHGRTTSRQPFGQHSSIGSRIVLPFCDQGWPKFASNLFFTSSDGAIVVAAWAPASAKADLPLGGQSSLSILIDVDTDYPFGDTADVRVTVTPSKNDSRDRFPVPVRLRIPSWAKSARVNGAPVIAGEAAIALCAPRKHHWVENCRATAALVVETGPMRLSNLKCPSLCSGRFSSDVPISRLCRQILGRSCLGRRDDRLLSVFSPNRPARALGWGCRECTPWRPAFCASTQARIQDDRTPLWNVHHEQRL